MKTELTPEESSRLIELGVDPKLASCQQYVESGKTRCGIELPPLPKPVFRLMDILAILPKEIEGSDLTICAKKDGWAVFYTGRKIRLSDTRVCAPELIDALYQLLIWCINNGHYNPKN